MTLLGFEKSQIAVLEARVKELEASRGVLWRGLADIVETRTAHPNATVRRLIAKAEEALNDDPCANVVPAYEFSKRAKEAE